MKTSDYHRVKGWFFIPEAPAKRIPGILTWSQEDGADLELIGGFSPESKSEQIREGAWSTNSFVGDASPSTIYGELDSGKRFVSGVRNAGITRRVSAIRSRKSSGIPRGYASVHTWLRPMPRRFTASS